MLHIRGFVALFTGTVAATVVFSLASFAQTDTCKFTFLGIHENGSATETNRCDTIVGRYEIGVESLPPGARSRSGGFPEKAVRRGSLAQRNSLLKLREGGAQPR